MKKLTSHEIRKMWIDFFVSKGHTYLASAPLIPIDDDSLLWINAGVTPLKKYFDGTIVPENKRLVSIQKCIRTNDIEQVGVTKRHQTFFEMLGNFSIGDYFKEEAIEFAFELLTSDEWFAIPKEKLYITVYTKDNDAYNKWHSLGVAKDHLIKLDNNFWEIGEGPCGPDSEIFYDRGEKYDPDHNALTLLQHDKDQERYVEIWNNVFSQYQAKENVPRSKYKELPHKNIDTGAGLERWCCIFQDVESNFDTDLFTPIIKQIEDISGMLYSGQKSFKVIADHIRAITFALADGAIFENTGRGYVLRRLLRRSVRYGKQIGITEPFMYKLVFSVIETMKDSYPELVEKQGIIQSLVIEEEKLFNTTLAAGERRLMELMKESTTKEISGYDAFKLYDTYGFPFELTEEYLMEEGFKVSKEEFDKYMLEQKKLASVNQKKNNSMSMQQEVLLNLKKNSEFVYDCYELKSSVIAIIEDDKLVKELTNQEGYVVFKKTCFYAESGGQVADTGMIIGKHFKARVVDVFKAPNGQHIHKIKLLDGKIMLKDDCDLVLDIDRRKNIEHNHSCVHILQYCLQEQISNTIKQAGSYVADDRFRFDFTYTGKILDDELIKVETRMNEMIQTSLATITEIMPLEEAKKKGAMALFSDKYKNEVRVVQIGDSLELCGGTHVKNTKDIIKVALISCESKGSNVYRIEGVSGSRVEDTLFEQIKPYNDEMIKLLMKAKNIVHEAQKQNIVLDFNVEIDNSAPTSYKDIIFNRNELQYVHSEVRDLEKQYLREKQKLALNDLSGFLEQTQEVNEQKVIVMTVHDYDLNVLKDIADALLNKLGKGLVFLANVKDKKTINFICRSNINTNAGLLVKKCSILSQGNGGGSATFAQGGGKSVDNLEECLATVLKEIV